MTPLLLSQLYAIRTLLEGVIITLEHQAKREEEARTAPTTPNDWRDGGCAHPAGRQVNATTMSGPPQILCLDCGTQRLGTVE